MTSRQQLSREDGSCGGMDQMLRSVNAPRRPAPIRVLFAKDRLHETGGTLYYLHVLPRLDPARVTPLLCAFAPRHPIAKRFEAVGIKPTFFGRTRWDPRSVRDLLQFARGHQVELLHLDGATSFSFGRLGARLTRLPTIAHFHSMLQLPPVRTLLNRQPMLSTSRSIAVSAAVRQWAIDHAGDRTRADRGALQRPRHRPLCARRRPMPVPDPPRVRARDDLP